MALSTTEPLATCWELTRPRLAARLIADGTGVCFICLHETSVFGFHKDVSPASTFVDSQKTPYSSVAISAQSLLQSNTFFSRTERCQSEVINGYINKSERLSTPPAIRQPFLDSQKAAAHDLPLFGS